MGCSDANDLSEDSDADTDYVLPECADNDNDGDGEIDYPNDSFCSFAGGITESPFCLAYEGS